MCYACTQCGKCGKFGEGENLASMVSIPCLRCGAVVNPFNGICTECGHRAFILAGSSARQGRAGASGAGDGSPAKTLMVDN